MSAQNTDGTESAQVVRSPPVAKPHHDRRPLLTRGTIRNTSCRQNDITVT